MSDETKQDAGCPECGHPNHQSRMHQGICTLYLPAMGAECGCSHPQQRGRPVTPPRLPHTSCFPPTTNPSQKQQDAGERYGCREVLQRVKQWSNEHDFMPLSLVLAINTALKTPCPLEAERREFDTLRDAYRNSREATGRQKARADALEADNSRLRADYEKELLLRQDWQAIALDLYEAAGDEEWDEACITFREAIDGGPIPLRAENSRLRAALKGAVEAMEQVLRAWHNDGCINGPNGGNPCRESYSLRGEIFDALKQCRSSISSAKEAIGETH